MSFFVVADTREKPEHRWHWHEGDDCAGTTVAKLDTADYTVKGLEDKLAIERKASTLEFAQNMTEKRFPPFLDRLQQYPHAFIICEFGWHDVATFPHSAPISPSIRKKIRVSANWMYSYMMEIQLNRGIHMILAETQENAKRAAMTIMKKAYARYNN